jgi:uncharacterized protein YjbJ (UPF0337 family)
MSLESLYFSVFHFGQRAAIHRRDDVARGEQMDKDRVKGAVDQAVGSAKRRIGGWTGNVCTQADGLVQQIKGKVETSRGKLKDVVREALDSTTAPHESEQVRREVLLAEERNLL